MQLSFLGKSYEASASAAIEGTPTGETATFMGQPYVRKQFNVANRQQPSGEFSYRGIRYSR